MLATAVLMLVMHGARADDSPAIYRIDDMPGEVHLSDSASAAPGVAVTRVVEDVRDGSRGSNRSITGRRVARDARFVDMIGAAATAQRLDPGLLHALIAVESGYRPDAVSPRGASGMTQLMPGTARDYGVTDVFDPKQNIDAGARHLRSLLDRYGQDTGRALAAYNVGVAALERSRAHSGAWPNPETALYVERVLQRWAVLRSQL